MSLSHVLDHPICLNPFRDSNAEHVCGGVEGGTFFFARKYILMNFRGQTITCFCGILSIFGDDCGSLLSGGFVPTCT